MIAYITMVHYQNQEIGTDTLQLTRQQTTDRTPISRDALKTASGLSFLRLYSYSFYLKQQSLWLLLQQVNQ